MWRFFVFVFFSLLNNGFPTDEFSESLGHFICFVLWCLSLKLEYCFFFFLFFFTNAAKLKKSQRKSKGKPCLSPLSASTELVISSGEIQKQTPKAKNKGNRANKAEAATQSSESVSKWQQGWKWFHSHICTRKLRSFAFFLISSY